MGAGRPRLVVPGLPGGEAMNLARGIAPRARRSGELSLNPPPDGRVILEKVQDHGHPAWAAGRRVHPRSGQRLGRALRAWHPDVRDLHPLHPGPQLGAAGPPALPPPGDRRSLAGDRPMVTGAADVADRGRRWSPGAHRGDPSLSQRGPQRRRPVAGLRELWPANAGPPPDGGSDGGQPV